MKLRMPQFGRKNEPSPASPQDRVTYNESLTDAINRAVTVLREADFCHGINGADKFVDVPGHRPRQKAWYLAATPTQAYLLLQSGEIVVKPDLWSSQAQVVSQRNLLADEEEIKKGLSNIYSRPVLETEKPQQKIITEENEDDEGHSEGSESQPAPQQEPTGPWHKRLPLSRQGRQLF